MDDSGRPPTYAIFCADPLDPRAPDPAFAREAVVARELGATLLLVDHDAIEKRHDAAEAVRRARVAAPGGGFYRGWMLRAEDYALLFEGLAGRGVRLLTTPAHYAACHHFPAAYPHIARWSPPAVWIGAEHLGDSAALAAALAPFGDGAVVLKDWVKSQAAGYWAEACFIPKASDLAAVRRVATRFLELQGASLVGGLVFRRHVPLAAVDGRPVEWRAFVLDGEVLGCWPRSDGFDEPPPSGLLAEVAQALPSPFASVDFTRAETGSWLVIETGDGQVSEIPVRADPAAILRPLAEAARRRSRDHPPA